MLTCWPGQYVAEIVSAIADAPLRGRDIEAAIQVRLQLMLTRCQVLVHQSGAQQNSNMCRSARCSIKDMLILERVLSLPLPSRSLPEVSTAQLASKWMPSCAGTCFTCWDLGAAVKCDVDC